ncbi:MFS transporter [Micromonospora sp. NPDC048999]|uniref:MFS transporter n=1 Tax=Micromonospora sp. NPDC048999 TaxID=3155391 RepID=UPI003407A85B
MLAFIPQFPGRMRYLAGMAIDSMGSGLYLPFSLLYFHHVSGLPLTTVGAGMSVAALIGLAGNPIGGALVDRFGARQVVVGGYLIRAAGFAYYLTVHNVNELIVATTLVALGDRSFPPAIQALMSELSVGVSRNRMMALQRAVRNAGLGLGGLAASIALGSSVAFAYQFIVVADAVSFLVAALLIISIRTGRRVAESAPGPSVGPPPSYRTVLRDKAFVQLTLTNVPVALCYNALFSLLPIFTIEALHADAQLPGLIFALTTAVVSLGQIPISRLQESSRRTRGAALGAAVFGTSCLGFAALVWLPSGPLVPIALIAMSMYYTVGELLHSTPSWSLAAAAAPATVRGRYLAIYQLSFSLAGVIAPALFTTLIALDAQLVWVLVGLGAILAAANLVRLEKRLPADVVASPAASDAAALAAASAAPAPDAAANDTAGYVDH